MIELRKKDITKWIIFLPAFAVLLTSLIILGIVITSEITSYNKAVEEAHIEYVKNAKLQAKDRIDKLVEYINFNEQFVFNEAKEEVRNIVNLGYKIIVDTYHEDTTLPRDMILKKVNSKLKGMRFFEDLSGYFFIFDLQGRSLMHGKDSAWEGQNLENLYDDEGNQPIREMLNLLQKTPDSFFRWRWRNNGETSFLPKRGYIKRFEPLNIFIGSGRYENEIRTKIKKETQKLLLNTRYGESGNGYVFAYDYHGINISHGNPQEVGKNRMSVTSDGQYIIRDFIDGSQINPEGFFMTYIATYRPGNTSDRRKISFVKAIPQFEWVIGTGAYVGEEQKALYSRKEVLKDKMKETISTIVFVSLAIIIILLWVMFMVSHKLKTMFIRYESSLLLSNQKIKEQKLIFETLYQKSADGVWLLKNNIFIDCNEAILKMFKAKNKQDLIGITLADLSPEFQPDGQNSYEKSLWMNSLALENGVHKFEWYAQACEGTNFWISVVTTSIRMQDNVIQHCSVRDITARKALEEENKKQKQLLIHQVEHDTLTGLPNRTLLQDRLMQAIKKAHRDGNVLAVLFVDIDKFKTINDTLGHDAGDVLLKTIASRMRTHVRETDTIARLSGDEFIILFDGCKDVSDIFVAIKKLLSAFSEPVNYENESFKVTMSIGVSVYPNDGESAGKLLKNADIAMYRAKEEGRNRYKFFDAEMNQETNEHIEVERSLSSALQNREFVLYYQPQINLQNEKIIGFEALIRWNHPTKGVVMPSYFIHIAEESDLIIEIGKWVVKEAMRQMKEWYDAGLNPGKVAINFAGKQLESPGLTNCMIECLNESGCKASWIEMEIVERFIMKDTQKSITLLQQLRELGIDISIDDFGTGHSSLAYLKQLPVTKLKIDQSFVQNLENSKEDRAIAKTIIELGRGLGLTVLAEGVETQEQKEFIYQSGCELMQGYFFSKPISAEAAEILLKNQSEML
ncbi:MAG: EAL domain-containing protein [Sulfurospirillaceae bacterium]|nr:EAL domain-containing protein [Sulfurospirillaceae bacterium]MDD2826886.1 EAL domain-containing protein [Sulfurospirillaceae bacterium]